MRRAARRAARQAGRRSRASRGPIARGPAGPAAAGPPGTRPGSLGSGWTARSPRSSRNRVMPAQPRRASSVADRNASHSSSATPSSASDSRIDSSAASRRHASRRASSSAQRQPPAVRRPAPVPIERQERLKNPASRSGSGQWARPWSRNAAQKRISTSWTEQVGVDSGRLEEQVAVADASRAGSRCRLGLSRRPSCSMPPQRLQGERLPVLGSQTSTRRADVVPEQVGEATAWVVAAARSRMTQRRVSAIRRRPIAAETSGRVRAGRPSPPRTRAAPPSGRRAAGTAASPDAGGSGCSPTPPRWSAAGPEVLAEHRLQVREPDAAARQLLAVAVLGQVRLAAEDLPPFATPP